MTGIITDKDRETLAERGIPEEDVLSQIERLAGEPRYVRLNRPCTVDDGIIRYSPDEEDGFLASYDEAASRKRVAAFIPASGAASRMFRSWFQFFSQPDFNGTEEARTFARELPLYAFYDHLASVIAERGDSLDCLLANGAFTTILDYILTARGLNYGYLPKAVILFHLYPTGTRTSLEEHLVEAARYVNGSGTTRLHITVSPEHLSDVRDLLTTITPACEKLCTTAYDIGLSVQHPSTDTVAVDMRNTPVRDEKGNLAFRPGGHGALLKNFSGINADIIFMKNIDNIVPDRLKDITVRYRKILGGVLISLRNEVFRLITALEHNPPQAVIDEAISFGRNCLSLTFPQGFEKRSNDDQRRWLADRLDRPLRVCGMVKNEGEPGGGPFWTEEKDGRLSIQIIEKVQVDVSSPAQQAIMDRATHFNPVDIACSITSRTGKSYDLTRYVDPSTSIVTQKSRNGQDIKALERPGLWNGAMAGWNTVFVEVPATTFNPVKEVRDLLRMEHRTDLCT